MAIGNDTLNTRRTLTAGGKSYDYFSLEAASEAIGDISRLPFSLKVLLENLLRFEDGRTVSVDDIKALPAWLAEKRSTREIAYRPARGSDARTLPACPRSPDLGRPCARP